MCSDLRNACSSIQYWTDYSQSSLGYLGFDSKEKKKYLDKYWSLVDEIREVDPKFGTDKWSYPDPFGPGLHMSDECYKYWQKVDGERQAQKEKEAKKKRFEKYWEGHAAEKQQYLSRINEINSELENLQEQFNSFEPRISAINAELSKELPIERQLAEIKRQQSEINGQKAKLGIFAGKQKKQLQEQIDALQPQIDQLEAAVKRQKQEIRNNVSARISNVEQERKPITDRLHALESEKKQIDMELTKDR